MATKKAQEGSVIVDEQDVVQIINASAHKIDSRNCGITVPQTIYIRNMDLENPAEVADAICDIGSQCVRALRRYPNARLALPPIPVVTVGVYTYIREALGVDPAPAWATRNEDDMDGTGWFKWDPNYVLNMEEIRERAQQEMKG
jgi:hypothetical protein